MFTMINEPFTLAGRTTDFSKEVISFCKNEKPTYINRPLIDQLIRSATSVGANYAEANNAASKSDFKNKIFIAKKEAAETKYWLSLLEDTVSDKQGCLKLLEDCHHLLMTFQKIINTLNHGKPLIVNNKRTVNSKP
jgi:four helix bundle protein